MNHRPPINTDCIVEVDLAAFAKWSCSFQ